MVTVVVEVSEVSRCPFSIRLLPAVSVIGVLQMLLELQPTEAPVVTPFMFFNDDNEPEAPVALFQFVGATTPALSLDAISAGVPFVVLPPWKLMLIVAALGGVIV